VKTDAYRRRFYREWVGAAGLYRLTAAVKETDVQVLTDKPVDKKFIEDKIQKYRGDIEGYINKDRRFLTALKPIAVERHAPPVVKKMARAAQAANVGPMAAVAGAIAEYIGGELLKSGCREVIVENGGDIFLKMLTMRTVAVYTGTSRVWKGLCLKIHPRQTPLGICTSSGTVGHSLSFGLADSTTILSHNTALADAVATACGNRVKSKDDLTSALDFARSIPGVTGVVIIIKNHLISWGGVVFAR